MIPHCWFKIDNDTLGSSYFDCLTTHFLMMIEFTHVSHVEVNVLQSLYRFRLIDIIKFILRSNKILSTVLLTLPLSPMGTQDHYNVED